MMITVTSVEAQNRFGELIDRSQREPVAITRRGRTVAYVISEHEMRELEKARRQSVAQRKIADWLALPGVEGVDLVLPARSDQPRAVDLC
ncbi:type II toxin-antitoxin system Phd/YefM family antitoxin [Sulfuricystis multivorans]|uniref:type II toxin-antitoxin system Phd/YefM family antitoxin n=1 Tax=Sulfuricystis multivorans TaxID=2211108 RepID=UPI0024DF8C2D|nr:type II toxin-antitoxin system prevent-host-death family antitoxin [Sulfuricystis multivorans]